LTEAAAKPRVQSAARTAAILLAVAGSDKGLSAPEISDAVGISRQVAYHLLHTLTEAGMVTRDTSNRYVLGLRVATLAEGFRRQLAPAEHLAPLVREVADATGETAYAAGWWLDVPTTLHVARGRNPIQAAEVPQGYAEDAHARASGKLLLAYADPARRDDYLRAHPPRRLTPRTIVNATALEDELALIRERGHAVDREEFAAGLSCLAVPLDEGRSPFALALSAPSERLADSEASYLETLRRVAAG
jgi:IclR family transcriptional regulator, acetate operon repressor